MAKLTGSVVPKVDLTLLKRTTDALEKTLAMADSIKDNADKIEWSIELDKAAGLAAGILTEAGLLLADIQGTKQVGMGSSPDLKTDLDKLFGKMPGGSN